MVEGGSDVGSKIVTAVKAKATEAVDVINKVMPQIKLGSAYGCWKIADQETCLYYPMFLYAAAFGAACVVLSSVLHYSIREGSRRRPLLLTLSLMSRTLACALFSVCLVFAVGSYYGVAKPLQAQSGGDVDRGLAFIVSISNFIMTFPVLVYECYVYGQQHDT